MRGTEPGDPRFSHRVAILVFHQPRHFASCAFCNWQNGEERNV